MEALKKFGRWVVPGEQQEEEEQREQWPSRLSFILASMGGAVGVGNLIRYPSIALRNSGLQWFIPYVGALIFIGLPILSLEISIGSAYRSGNVLAFNRLSRRLRGVGLSAVFLGYIAATYYVVIMAYVMTYFRYSFQRPIPWLNDNRRFFLERVHQNPAPVNATGPGTLVQYPARGVVWETLAWTVFTWAGVYASIFRGVAITGKVVYVTMLLPLVTTCAILVRAVTLENSWRGIKLYIGEWNGAKLRGGEIWKDAIIQIFYSVGTGFGIFTAYASYNPVGANAIQDVIIIACGNSIIEMCAAFAAFGVIGYLGIDTTKEKLSTFETGFITYPTALAKLPGANAWAVVFFFTLYLLGIDSAFAYLEGLTTAVSDTTWGRKIRKSMRVLMVTFVAMLLSFQYTTRFGYHLLDAMDKWVTGIALMLSTWAECVGATSLYRYRDVVAQTGMPAFVLAQSVYVGSMVLGLLIGHTVSIPAGVAVYVGVLVIGTILAAVISKRPEICGPESPRCLSKIMSLKPLKILSALWWLTSYSGNQLAKDLNAVVARGKNWGLPFFWAPLLRWIAAPILITILSLSYSEFKEEKNDPLHIFAFVFAHLFVICIVVGMVIPQSLSIWVCNEEKEAHDLQYATSPCETLPAAPLETVDAESVLEKKEEKLEGDASTS